MQSLFSFIVQPKNKRYENEVDINGKKLIINTTMDDHKYVSRIGVVKSIPKIGETNIKIGDEVIPWKKFNSNMAISIEYNLEY